MKPANYMYYILFVSLILTSCMKIIDVDINDAEPMFVIEGEITDQPGPYVVKVSKTIQFSSPNNFNGVENALVTIHDDLGTIDTLTATAPGIYQTNTIAGAPGRVYTLRVEAEGKTFSAQSRMPFPVPLDSVTVDNNSFGSFSFKTIVPHYVDPVNTKNFYRFRLRQNQQFQSNIFVREDALSNGDTIRQPLFGGGDLETGDTVDIFMLGIDENVYLYFYSLNQNAGNGAFVATPANPVSNFGDVCLGYFSAQALQVNTVIVP